MGFPRVIAQNCGSDRILNISVLSRMPRDCTALPFGCAEMYSPREDWYPMTSSKNQRKTPKKAAASKAVVVYTKNSSNPSPSFNPKRKKRPSRNKLSLPKMPSPDRFASEYARLIDDPCKGPVAFLQSISPGAIVKRVRSLVTLHATGANNSGMFIWFPGFHNRGSSTATYAFNCLQFEPAAASTGLVNSTADPLGTAIATSGAIVADPAGTLIGGGTSTFVAGSTVAACMTLHYTGTTTSNSGEFFVLDNLRTTMFSNGATSNLPSPDNMTVYASYTTRSPLDGLEVKWEPDLASTMRGSGAFSAASANADKFAQDACFIYGGAATAASSNGASSGKSNGFGIAWKSLNTANTNEFYLELTKVIILEVTPGLGLVESVTTTPPSSSLTEMAIYALDHGKPGWRAMLGDSVSHAAAGVGNMALAGFSRMAQRAIGL